jgi:hypothetical protein
MADPRERADFPVRRPRIRVAYLRLVTSEVLRPAELVALLADPEWCEAPIVEGHNPVVVVDLDDPAVSELATEPPRWRVVVGVSTDPAGAPPPDLCDIAVTTNGPVAAGWVGVSDIAAVADGLVHTAELVPVAAATMAQVLRIGPRLTIGEAFTVESLAYSLLLAGSEFKAWLDSRSTRRPQTGDQPVLIEHDGNTLTVVLNRPEARNAYSASMRDALVEILRAAVAMSPPPSVVIRGNGASFSAGGDLTEFGTTPSPVLAHGIRTARAPGLLLHQLGATAFVHGPCVGAGVELPAFCRRVEAHPDTTVLLPEVAMGLIPGAGGTASIPRRIGRQRTAYLALSGATVDAQTALGWGLFDAISD